MNPHTWGGHPISYRFDSKTVPLFYKILRETDKAASHALAAEIHSELEWIQENLAEEGMYICVNFGPSNISLF